MKYFLFIVKWIFIYKMKIVNKIVRDYLCAWFIPCELSPSLNLTDLRSFFTPKQQKQSHMFSLYPQNAISTYQKNINKRSYEKKTSKKK